MAGNALATAYAQIVPKMDGLKEKLASEVSSAAPKGAAGLGKGIVGSIASIGIGTALGNAITGGLQAATGAAKSIISDAFGNIAEFEQLKGGVETLFGANGQSVQEYAESVGKSVADVQGEYDGLMQAQSLVMDNAQNAYKTMGISENEYMEQTTSMAASLKQSLGGDAVAAAEKADLALTSMVDNASKMGTPLENIQNAYAGFAKQNYTMLDNLKLGYGGTKEEMQRLLADAEKFSGIKYDISSYADIVDAIQVVQENMGIAGNAAAEASSTIEGSTNAAKAAWQNWLTSLGDDSADMSDQTSKLVDAVVTAAGNIGPRVMTIIQSLSSTLSTELPGIVSMVGTMLAGTLPDIIPSLVAAIVGCITAIVDVIPTLVPPLMDGAIQLFMGLVEALPEIIPALTDAVTAAIDHITELLPDLIPQLLAAGIALFMALAEAVPQILGSLQGAIGTLLDSLFKAVGDGATDMLNAAGDMMKGLLDGVGNAAADVWGKLGEVKDSVLNFFGDVGWWLYDSGKAAIQGFIDGIGSMINGAKDAAENVLSSIRNLFPFSPAKEGPFSGRGWTLYSGMSITSALAEGIAKEGDKAVSTTRAIMGRIHGAASGGVTVPVGSAFGRPANGAFAGSSQGSYVVQNISMTVDGTKDPEETSRVIVRDLQRYARMGLA